MRQTILVVEDDRDLAEALEDTLELAGYEPVVAHSAAAALEILESTKVDLAVSDVHMRGLDGHGLLKRIKGEHPELPVLLMTAYATVQKAVEAMREGAVDYLAKPFEADQLVAAVRKYAIPPEPEDDPVAEDPRSLKLLGLARKVAASDATIMVTGESGTGKEVLARYLHRHSRRSEGPFVAINCAAIPENMLEATLFGYEKGAFTGAYKASPGKFERANGGTLLLDEISEMELGLQAKLLRVLQEKEVERLGGGETLPLDVRVLATSNRNMKQMVAEGGFREDLYYRLNVFPLRMPPLRERPGDIPELAERFVARAARATGIPVPRLSESAHRRLLAHDWPGNVRELDNLIQRAVILAEDEQITADDLHFEAADVCGRPVPMPPPAMDAPKALDHDLKAHEFQLIAEALRGGSRQEVAEKLGISPRTLRYKIAQMREAGYDL